MGAWLEQWARTKEAIAVNFGQRVVTIFVNRALKISVHGKGFVTMAEPAGKRRAAQQRTRESSQGLFFSLSKGKMWVQVNDTFGQN